MHALYSVCWDCPIRAIITAFAACVVSVFNMPSCDLAPPTESVLACL